MPLGRYQEILQAAPDFPGVRYHPKFRLMTWQVMGKAVAACSLQFFTADPYDVEGVSLRRPASTVIKLDPPTRQTTSSKRGYPDPMAPFLGGYRCPRRCAAVRSKFSFVGSPDSITVLLMEVLTAPCTTNVIR